MKYLTVGTREITNELFKKIEDTEPKNMKPRGGLWLTEYVNPNYNEWIEFMIDEPVVLFFKNRHNSLWRQPCSLVTLKDDANIFCLKKNVDLEYLKKNYPLPDSKFSYQQLSDIYDGIFVDMYGLLREVDSNVSEKIYKFGVNSLILFNLDCIDYYNPGTVFIEPFDYEAGVYETVNYDIQVDNVKKRVLKKDTNNI